MINSVKPLTVLFFGGGQDSTAILLKIIHDSDFKNNYVGDSHLLVLMSDTGNEYPDTYEYVKYIAGICVSNQIEFVFIQPSMGFHSRTWQSLEGQMILNSNVMGVGFPKSCTDKLKISVCDAFLQTYIVQRYNFKNQIRKKTFYSYYERFGKLKTIIGFAKGEESRMLDSNSDSRPKWKRDNVDVVYPLVEIGFNRKDCQDYIASLGYQVPSPSCCMFCPFQNAAEIVYLNRFYPREWLRWVYREKMKFSKNADKPTNLGVKGNLTLSQFLEKSLKTYGSWTDQQLKEYRFSHGHCVKSKY